MIHLIYSGYGRLVFTITFGISLLANFITDHFLGSRYYVEHKWPLAVALMVSGMVCNLVVMFAGQEKGTGAC